MRQNKQREKMKISFSYLDAFFLLLAGLVLSFGIYFATEQRKSGIETGCQMTVLVSYEKDLQQWIPEEGEVLWGEQGDVIGQVTAVRVLSVGVSQTVELDCDMKRSGWQEGESFLVETKECIKEGVIQKILL